MNLWRAANSWLVPLSPSSPPSPPSSPLLLLLLPSLFPLFLPPTSLLCSCSCTDTIHETCHFSLLVLCSLGLLLLEAEHERGLGWGCSCCSLLLLARFFCCALLCCVLVPSFFDELVYLFLADRLHTGRPSASRERGDEQLLALLICCAVQLLQFFTRQLQPVCYEEERVAVEGGEGLLQGHG